MVVYKQMAARYFERNEDRIKRWVEMRYNYNPEEIPTFEEFCEAFPADAGWDKPTLDWFFEEYLYNLLEQYQIQEIYGELELKFQGLLEEMKIAV